MLSMSISLVAVFIPILLMGGIVGRLFREFAVTLCGRHRRLAGGFADHHADDVRAFLGQHNASKHGRLYRVSESVLSMDCSTVYDRGCAGFCAISARCCSSPSGTLALNVYLYIIVPKGFFPQQDTGRLNGQSMRRPGYLLSGDAREADAASSRSCRTIPAVDYVVGFTGGGGGAHNNTGRMFIALKPLEERKVSADEVINRLRGKLSHVPGATLFLQAVQDIRVGGRGSNAQYQYTLQADNLTN